MRDRVIAALALAIPVCAGLAYLAAFGAPSAYLAINTGALAAATAMIAFTPYPASATARRVLIGAALVLVFAPLVTGPSLSGVARWLPIGPFTLHAGMLVVPMLVVLAAADQDYAPAALSAALLAAVLQPDMATGAALTLAAFGLYDATKDWRYGVFAAVAFFASLVAAMGGELPARPFVEHVIFELVIDYPLAALGLLGSLLAGFFLILAAVPGREPARQALAGCLFGFSFAGFVSNYPSALVGYGAAPILGFGLALALLAARGTGRSSADFPASTGD